MPVTWCYFNQLHRGCKNWLICVLLLLIVTDMVFNTRKTVCMAILPTFLRRIVLPEITLCEKVLDYVDSYKYVGYLLSNSGKIDALELQHQYRLLFCRANSLIRKSAMCSLPVKKHLYRTCCANVYGVDLWRSFRVSMLRKLIVCFNNSARMFFWLCGILQCFPNVYS